MTRKLLLFIWRLLSALLGMSEETLRFVRMLFQSQASLIAENLFPRKQLTNAESKRQMNKQLSGHGRTIL
jgi:hypothetical protein